MALTGLEQDAATRSKAGKYEHGAPVVASWDTLVVDEQAHVASYLTSKFLGRLFSTSRGGRAVAARDTAWASVCEQFCVVPTTGLTPSRASRLRRWTSSPRQAYEYSRGFAMPVEQHEVLTCRSPSDGRTVTTR